MGVAVLFVALSGALLLLLGATGLAMLYLLIRQSRMDQELRRLRERVDRLEPSTPSLPLSPIAADHPAEPAPATPPGPSRRRWVNASEQASRQSAGALGVRRAWRRLESQLLLNWTGWLGVMALVSGLAFLTVSVAIRMQAFERFALLLAISGVMAVPRVLVPPHHRLRSLSRWLSSGAAALVLFGCAGATGWPGLGLQWIDDPGQGLLLLAAAVALNLVVAETAGSAWLATGHVVISLLPLSLAAPSAEASVWTGIVAALGLWGRAGRWGPSRCVVTIAVLVLQLWIAQRSGSVAPAWVTFPLVGIVLARNRQGSAGQPSLWGLTEVACAWAGLMVVWSACPVGSVPRAAAFAVAALAAWLLGLESRRGGTERLALIHWVAALLLSMASLLALHAEINAATVQQVGLVLINTVFLQDAIRDRDSTRARLAGVSLLLMDAGLLLILLDRQGEPGLATPVFVLAAALLQQRLLEPMRSGTAARLIPGALAIAVSLLPPAAVIAAIDPGGARAWGLFAVLGLMLGLRRWPRRQGTFHEAPLAVSGAVGAVQLLATAGRRFPLSVIAEQLLPVFSLGAVMAISSASLTASLRGGRTAGLLLCGLTLFRAVAMVQGALPAELLWIAPLAWILLAGLAVALSCRWTVSGRQGEAMVVLAMAYLAFLLFAMERLFQDEGAGQPLLQLAVDGTAVAVLVGWRLLGGRVPLAGRPLWEFPRRYAGELALTALVISLLRWLPHWGAATGLAWLAVLLWRPELAGRWPRARGQGLLAFWAGLLALSALPATQNLPLALAVGSMVVACTRFPSPAASGIGPEAAEASAPGMGWLHELAAWVGQHPHRWLAVPLSLVVTVLMARHATSIWLTLTWSIEALVLFSLSVWLRDRPLRIGSLGLMGLCLLRLVSVDMRQADLMVRGLVFTGVGLVLMVMNGLTSRIEKP